MQIDIPNDDYHRLASQAAACGFADVTAYLAALAGTSGEGYLDIDPPHRRPSGNAAQEQALGALPAMPDDLSAEEAIAALRPPVIDDPTAGAAESWPPDEPIGVWIEELRRLRSQSALRPLS
jgi:hypothetical protein